MLELVLELELELELEPELELELELELGLEQELERERERERELELELELERAVGTLPRAVPRGRGPPRVSVAAQLAVCSVISARELRLRRGAAACVAFSTPGWQRVAAGATPADLGESPPPHYRRVCPSPRSWLCAR